MMITKCNKLKIVLNTIHKIKKMFITNSNEK